jgi:hypothetical protein
LQIAALAFEIIERVGAEHTVRGKEFIELYARCESEHPAQLGPAAASPRPTLSHQGEGFASVSIRSPKRFSRVNNLPQPAQLTSPAVNIP